MLCIGEVSVIFFWVISSGVLKGFSSFFSERELL